MARKPRRKKPMTIEVAQVLALVGELAPAKSAEVAKRLGADQLLLRTELMALERQGKVHRTGQTRGTRWFLGAGAGGPPVAGDDDLPPEAGSTPAKRRRGPKEKKLDPYRDQLGRVPDAEVSKLAGVSQRTVQNYRKRHQIAGFGVTGAPAPVSAEKAPKAPKAGIAAPAPVAEAKAPKEKKTADAAPATGFVWRVEWKTAKGTETGYVVGGSVVDAGGVASARTTGEIISLSLVGRVL